MPVGTDFHRKFVVRNPEGRFFKYLVRCFKCVQIELADVIFDRPDDKSEEKITYYVRKRVSSPLSFV